MKTLRLDSSLTFINPSLQTTTKEIPMQKQVDHTSRAAVLFKIIFFLMGKGESVVYAVMHPAFLNEQARNFIRKQPIPVGNTH